MELGSGSSDSSTVDQNHDQHHHQMLNYEVCDESSELELGLGLSLGSSKIHHQIPRILTANDLQQPCSTNLAAVGVGVVSPPSSSSSSCSSLGLRPSTKSALTNINTNTTNISNKNVSVAVGTKRAASPTGVSQVVGWPPIRSYRMNSMANQAKSIATGEHNSQFDEIKGKNGIFAEDKGNVCSKDRVANKGSMFVKVNMDGVAIGRKVDLTAHTSYESLAQTLEEMFTNNGAEKTNAEELILMPKVTRPSKLLDGTSDFVLTYEDKDGDWMLVGDVPWGMFVTSVKRLKIMRTSDANGLAPRTEDRSSKQKRRPI
ncbi:auxin-responsive protein IAA12-like [Silene latifolia]|uniref:auxin-responsive protein IAA12-like n=1 Tax=Silene latifolia TaxID=37657 RepID=UPI003D77E1F0